MRTVITKMAARQLLAILLFVTTRTVGGKGQLNNDSGAPGVSALSLKTTSDHSEPLVTDLEVKVLTFRSATVTWRVVPHLTTTGTGFVLVYWTEGNVEKETLAVQREVKPGAVYTVMARDLRPRVDYYLYVEVVTVGEVSDLVTNRSDTIVFRTVRPYYVDRAAEGLPLINMDEVIILTLVFIIWVVSIITFVRKWGKIRTLQPREPRYKHHPKNLATVKVVDDHRDARILYDRPEPVKNTHTSRLAAFRAKRKEKAMRRSPIAQLAGENLNMTVTLPLRVGGSVVSTVVNLPPPSGLPPSGPPPPVPPPGSPPVPPPGSPPGALYRTETTDTFLTGDSTDRATILPPGATPAINGHPSVVESPHLTNQESHCEVTVSHPTNRHEKQISIEVHRNGDPTDEVVSL